MSATATSQPRHIHVEHVMGTVFSFDVRGAANPDRAMAAACARLHELDAAFSTFRDDSAIRRLDRGELTLDDVDEDVREVLAECARLTQASDGFFCIRPGGALDPSAYVKGWAGEEAVSILTAHGHPDVCLSAGGDVVTRGRPSPRACWRVGVQHPLDRGALAAVVEADGIAVATSGSYERGAHILDPRSATAAQGVLSVTVTGPDLGRADAFSTAAFARGADAARWTLELPAGYEAMTITTDEQVLTTAGFPVVAAAR